MGDEVTTKIRYRLGLLLGAAPPLIAARGPQTSVGRAPPPTDALGSVPMVREAKRRRQRAQCSGAIWPSFDLSRYRASVVTGPPTSNIVTCTSGGNPYASGISVSQTTANTDLAVNINPDVYVTLVGAPGAAGTPVHLCGWRFAKRREVEPPYTSVSFDHRFFSYRVRPCSSSRPT